MNNKTFKSITGIVLASAIGVGGYHMGRQSNAIAPQPSFPEQLVELPAYGSIMVFTCTPETHDTFLDRNGDGNYETYRREWYSNINREWTKGQETALYHPLSIQEMRTEACR